MKDLKKITNLTCWLVTVFLLFVTAESKAQVKEMSAQELTNASTAVFYGKCSKKSCSWDENHRIIYTYVTVLPDEYLKGNLGSEAVIAVPGGQVGNIIYEVSDMPVFVEGEELVAFVRTNPSGKNLITGAYQGKLKIDTDQKTGNKMVLGTGPGAETDLKIQGVLKTREPERVRLQDFIAKIKGYLKN